jgi:hypothetical protein
MLCSRDRNFKGLCAVVAFTSRLPTLNFQVKKCWSETEISLNYKGNVENKFL